jgi:putative ABC transport system permease protein
VIAALAGGPRLLHPALVFGSLLTHKARSLVSVLAIAAGVALGLAVQLVNEAAVAEFASAARQISGRADLTLRGPRSGFDEGLYPAMAIQDGVVAASPALEVEAGLADRDGSLRVVGIDLFRAAAIQPALLAGVEDPFDALRGDVVFPARSFLQRHGLSVGQHIALQSGNHRVEVRIGGVMEADAAGASLAVMDLGGAQTLFGREGLLTRIDIVLRPGLDPQRWRESVELSAGLALEAPGDAGDAASRMTRAYRVNLNVLALVALFTGGLLVFSTQALSVARRRTQLAFLRVIGATGRQVSLLVLSEGTVIGLAGALAGVGLGLALAWLVLGLIGGDLGAGFFEERHVRLVVAPGTVVLLGLAGVVAALAGSLGPALEAARAPLALALKSGDDVRAFGRLPVAWPGSVCLMLAAGFTLLPPVDGLPLFGYGAIALLLLGTLLLLPRWVGGLLGWLPAPRAVAAVLSLERLRAYPLHAAVSLSAIVAAVSLMVAMGIMVGSFRASLSDWLEGILPADLYLRSGARGDSAFLSAADQARLRAVPGLGRVEFLRWDQIILAPGGPRTTLLARDGVERDAPGRLPLVGQAERAPAGTLEVWASEAAAAVHGLQPGQRWHLPLGGLQREVQVAGVWRDYARQNGALLMDRGSYVRLTGDERANDAGLWLAPGADAAAVRQALAAVAGEGAEILSPGDIRDLSMAVFDRTFAVTYALEAVALVIGLLGLSSAIGTEVIARRREFGMLRHLGVSRRDIAQVLAAEGAAVGTAGLAVGAVLGFAMSLILIHVVNRQSFHWSMELHVPWLGLAVFFSVLLGLATLVAVVGGRQAMGVDAVRAVREDW